MNRTLTLIIAALSLAMLAAAGPAAAETPDPFAGYDQERFRVTIKGFQKMVQQNSHPGGEDECDASNYSSGSERLTFHSTRAVVVRAVDLPGFRNPYLASGRAGIVKLPTKARVVRSFTPRIGPTPQWCGGTGGSGPAPRDCGERTTAPWRIAIDYSYNRRGRIQARAFEGLDPYRNCPGTAGSFPYLLEESGAKGRPIFAEIPKHEIFDRDIGKIIAIARGHYRHRIQGYFYDTTVRWELTFHRIDRRG